MNPREFCTLRGFPIAILTTYEFDPLFFERVVLHDLRRGGARSIVVLADARRASDSIRERADQITRLGLDYRVLAIEGRGAFHPKLALRLSATGGIVGCGSTNLTVCGWLGTSSEESKQGNIECFGAWSVGAAEVSVILETLASLLDRDSDRKEFLDLASIERQKPPQAPSVPALLMSGPARPLGPALAERWRGRRFRRAWIATGSTDPHGAWLRWLHATFGVEEAVVVVDREQVQFLPASLGALPCRVRLHLREDAPRLHAKVVFLEGDEGAAALYGSANCSAAAWTVPFGHGGNVEAIAVLDHAEREGFRAFLSFDREADGTPLLVAPAEREETQRESMRELVGAWYHRRTRELLIALRSPISADTRVEVRCDGVTSIAEWRSPTEWIVRNATLEVAAETRFVTALIGPDRRETNTHWVEDVERLRAIRDEAEGDERFGDLGDRAARASEILRDVQALFEAIATTTAARRETQASGRSGASSRSPTPDVVGEPLSHEAILVDIASIGVRRSSAPLGTDAFPSYSGLFRAIFGESDVLRREPPSVGRDGDGNEDDEDESEDPAPPDLTPLERTASERARLLRAADGFRRRLIPSSRKSALTEPAFFERANATRLQQACIVLLGTYFLARRGGWITDADERDWRALALRSLEAFFSVPVGGERGLIRAIQRVERAGGSADEFASIVGDGCIAVLATAALVHRGGAHASSPLRFEEQLLLNDISSCEAIWPAHQHDRRAALAERLSITIADTEWQAALRRTSDALRTLRGTLKRLHRAGHRARRESTRVGDWLWNPGVDFCRVLAPGQDERKVVVERWPAGPRLEVFPSVYLNVRAEGLLTDDLDGPDRLP